MHRGVVILHCSLPSTGREMVELRKVSYFTEVFEFFVSIALSKEARRLPPASNTIYQTSIRIIIVPRWKRTGHCFLQKILVNSQKVLGMAEQEPQNFIEANDENFSGKVGLPPFLNLETF